MSSMEGNIKDFKTRTCRGGCRRTAGTVRGRTPKQEADSGGHEASGLDYDSTGCLSPASWPPGLALMTPIMATNLWTLATCKTSLKAAHCPPPEQTAL